MSRPGQMDVNEMPHVSREPIQEKSSQSRLFSGWSEVLFANEPPHRPFMVTFYFPRENLVKCDAQRIHKRTHTRTHVCTDDRTTTKWKSAKPLCIEWFTNCSWPPRYARNRQRSSHVSWLLSRSHFRFSPLFGADFSLLLAPLDQEMHSKLLQRQWNFFEQESGNRRAFGLLIVKLRSFEVLEDWKQL